MISPIPCSDPARLKEWLDGTLPAVEEAQLNRHLESCERCQEALEGLVAGKESWSNLARHLGREQADPAKGGPAVGEAFAAENRELPIDSANGEDPSLPFLSPSTTPGNLGRLAHYEVSEIIGRGGMGVVVKAFDEKLHRVVAIKVMAPQLATNAIARKRFIREARAAAAVRNDHVIGIYAVEEIGGLPYLVMEYVSGLSLQERLDQAGHLELKEILRIGMQTAAGLAAAHAQGLIHRDIKPANILLENGVERVKITDFGLARAADDASLSQSGVVAGTPQYMAPEQAEGRPVDHRADLFSLGSVLYTLSASHGPFRASTIMGVLKRVCEESPRPIKEINPEIPDWLVEIIARLHAKDPAERLQSAAQVAELLGQHLAQLQQPGPATMPSQASRLLLSSQEEQDQRASCLLRAAQTKAHRDAPTLALSARARAKACQRRPRRWFVTSAVLIALGGGLGLTEAMGVTGLAATAIRIFTPDGTLVVEVEDPDVQVTIEGDGGVVITGAGPQSVRLRPGSYRCKAMREGTLLREDVVTISRGGREVVRVGREPPARPGDEAIGEVRCFRGHTAPVGTIVVSPDSRHVLSAGADGSVRLWDVATGKQRRCFEGHQGVVYALALSPDGRLALSGSGGPDAEGGGERSVCLWEVESGKELHRTIEQGPAVTTVALSADAAQALLGSYDGTVRLWDVAAWKEVSRFDHTKGLWSVSFSPDGHLALTAGGCDSKGLVRLWDLKTGRELRRFEGHEDGVWHALFTPDGRTVVTSSNDQTLRWWETATGKELGCFRHEGGIPGLAVSPDGRFALSGSYDRSMRLWDLRAGRKIRRFEGHPSSIRAVAFAPDGLHAGSSGEDGTVRWWRLARDKQEE